MRNHSLNHAIENAALHKSVSFKFKGLNEDDEKAIADAQDVKAGTRQKYLQEGVVSQEEVRKAISEDPHSGFFGIDVSDIPDGDDEDYTGQERHECENE